MMKLSDMRLLLEAHQIRLTKSLGQNFLHDGNQLRKIAAAAQLAPGDRVLEIGPGLGPLTECLLETGAEVLAIEMDARLVAILRERLAAHPRFTLQHADGLEVLQAPERDWNDWKLVANLPYSVASSMLVDCALGATAPARLVVTLQLEVARRLVARPGTSEYGVLPLLVGQRYAARLAFTIASGCFHPAPDVDSACVVLDRRPVPVIVAERRATFARLVKLALSERRKMMFKLLKRDWPEAALRTAYAGLGLDPTIRAERVTPAQFAALTLALSPLNPPAAATVAPSP